MNDLPTIVVVSSSNTKPKSLIKLITKETPTELPSGLFKQPWKIDTKYYSAIVNLIGVAELFEFSEDFLNQIEALIIHMDSNKSSGLDDLKQWEKLETESDPEIKLLIANYCNEETKITRSDAVTWCLNKGFEFVELYPSDMQTIQNSDEDIIIEKFGVNRVIESLEAHTWSNLVLKKMKNPRSQTTGSSKCCSQVVAPMMVEKSDDLPDEFLGEDDFTELFTHLHMMKDSLQSLPISQRKQCAEQMVTAFWKAIGDEDESLDNI
uniref:Alpha-and gamma-adaptin-binding protein p34 n=1 Tax=Dendroctonus ponderosae TaxID=77166 RepID=J3JUL0_DENPD|nr:unknown [Dendroctonus ponderosae]